MGLLAGKKSRTRINKDPNNTKWTRDTTTFGHKILRAHGWQPGEFLGAQGAPHADMLSEASASHIRVAVKDDMVGLGYARARDDAVTGLDVFSDLLSRLNGRGEEDVEGDRAARVAGRTSRYVAAKWGPMRFVSGGLLVSEDVRAGEAGKGKRKAEGCCDGEREEAKRRRREERRARKMVGGEGEVVADGGGLRKRRKLTKEGHDTERLDEVKTATDEDSASIQARKSKKDKKKRNRESDKSVSDKSAKESKMDKRKSHDGAGGETKSRRDKQGPEERDEVKSKREKKRKKNEVNSKSAAETAGSVPSMTASETGSGTSTPVGGRNFVRSRFIAQKRQAVLDAKALAQIFMVKTAS